MNWGEILKQVQRIGHLSDTEFAQTDYKDNCVTFANNALLDLATTSAKQLEHISFTTRILPNMLDTVPDIEVRHETEDIIYETNQDAVSYYFEVCGTGQINIDTCVAGFWTTNKTITAIDTGDFVTYRGFIEDKDPDCVGIRFVFTGAYRYSIKNTAFYSEKYSSSVDDIPSFGRYSIIDIKKIADSRDAAPFWCFDKKTVIKFDGDWLSEDRYYIYDDHTLVIPNISGGVYTVYYNAYPRLIKSDIVSTEEVDIEPQFAALIPLFIASKIYADDDAVLSATCYNTYVNQKSQLYNATSVTTEWTSYYGF